MESTEHSVVKKTVSLKLPGGRTKYNRLEVEGIDLNGKSKPGQSVEC